MEQRSCASRVNAREFDLLRAGLQVAWAQCRNPLSEMPNF